MNILANVRNRLVNIIQTRGPLTVAEYMKIVLTNSDNGFYMNKDVFGTKGHFTTNPEISQIFGEICGVWIINEWQRFQCPKPLRIVELGPGRGTLMSDIARTLNQFRQSREVASLHLVEVSPFLTQLQEQTLCGTTSLIGRNESNRSNHNSITKNGLPVTWYRSLNEVDALPSGFTAFIAHEFFDALPIHKFVRDPNSNRAWRELLVDYDKNHELRFSIARQPTTASRLLTEPYAHSPLEHLEICPEAGLHVENIMKRLNRTNSGCMLMCDYGYEDDKLQTDRDTFRGFKEHQQWPALTDPGTADLTADVDFGYLKSIVQDQATIFGPVPQARFLLKCGLEQRLNQLLENASAEERENLKSGVKMMVDDMGERFKFMALFPRGTESLFINNPPAGFEDRM